MNTLYSVVYSLGPLSFLASAPISLRIPVNILLHTLIPVSCLLLNYVLAKVSLELGLETMVYFSRSSQQKGTLPWGLNPWLGPGNSVQPSLSSHLLDPGTCCGCRPRLRFLPCLSVKQGIWTQIYKNTNPLIPFTCLRLLLIDETKILPETQALPPAPLSVPLPWWSLSCLSSGVAFPVSTGSLRRKTFPDLPGEASSSYSRPFCAFPSQRGSVFVL